MQTEVHTSEAASKDLLCGLKLNQFTGNGNVHEGYAKPGLLISDGVKYLWEQCGGKWLVDAIERFQRTPEIIAAKVDNPQFEAMQVWSLQADKSKCQLVLTGNAEGGDPSDPYAERVFYASEFPFGEGDSLTLLVVQMLRDGFPFSVLCLDSEV